MGGWVGDSYEAYVRFGRALKEWCVIRSRFSGARATAPTYPFSKDVFRKALGAVSSVGLLGSNTNSAITPWWRLRDVM